MKHRDDLSKTEAMMREESAYFYAMCGREDRDLLDRKERTPRQNGRLLCIASALGMRGVILVLSQQKEKQIDAMLAYLNGRTFAEVAQWMEEFIAAIEDPLLRQAAQDVWREKQERICPETFRLRDLL